MPPLTLYDEDIEWQPEVKYLGTTLDRRLTWNENITTLAQKGKQRLGEIHSLIHKNTKLSTRNQLTLYKGIVLPTMLYACEVWGYAAETHIKKLQTIQNKTLRLISGAPWFIRGAQIHNDYKIKTIWEIIQDRTKTFYEKTKHNDNTLIQDLGNYDTTHNKYPTPLDILTC